jgi:hypothetical protein
MLTILILRLLARPICIGLSGGGAAAASAAAGAAGLRAAHVSALWILILRHCNSPISNAPDPRMENPAW